MEELFIKKYEEILQLFSITAPKGYTKEELEKVELEVSKIPEALKLFYLKYGKSEELLHLQDQFILPNQYQALIDEEYIIFFDENQGVCQAGIKKADANQPDPPVYVRMDSEEWLLSVDKVSDFLVAMFGYQASICLEYSPEEFYFITAEEKEKITQLFEKKAVSFKNWLECEITVYGNQNSGRVAVMEQEDYDIQMNYAANTKEEYERMDVLLSEMGEAI